jgi:protein-S-isoprenylcysteine O-methyltransferase Ste14
LNPATLLVLLLDSATIGALPLFFFRRDGSLNLRWWATAFPFFLCPLLLVAGFLRVLPGSDRFTALYPGQGLAPIPIALCSIALIFLTLGTHHTRISLWHQSNDAPAGLVTSGAYRYIRHPFYTSFLLAFAASDLFFPHPAVVALSLYVLAVLHWTAAAEERKLRASEFGEEYGRYMARSGRFFPQVRRSAR